MLVGKRILVMFTLMLSVTGFLLSLVAGMGVWIIREPVIIRASQIFGRIETALAFVDQGLQQARADLARAEGASGRSSDMSKRNLTSSQSQKTLRRKTLARMIQRSFAPKLGDALEIAYCRRSCRCCQQCAR